MLLFIVKQRAFGEMARILTEDKNITSL